METTHFDVLVVGAGISGVAAGYHLQTKCPNKTYAILEGRDRMGGTWDLFRYPGIRSDSDMYTLGFPFRPWKGPKAIADGASILEYVKETAAEYGIDRKIRYNHRVERASWSSDAARWTVDVVEQPSGRRLRFTCSFLYACAGYYDYENGHRPAFPGEERFRGRIVHPQKWTPDIDYEGKRVVVVGSGATAVTLVPALAQKAAHVTMLQRSPTYIVSLPDKDPLARWLGKRLPAERAYSIVRWKNVAVGMGVFAFCRRYPERAKKLILKGVQRQLGPDYDIGRDFTPRYAPWDQRMCLVPNGDLFDAIKSGRASVVTDHIDTFTENGIRVRSGADIEADLVVTATGLSMKFLGGIALEVDGRRIEPSQTMAYKGMMFSDVPNLAIAIGYTNASWTLKCDLTGEYVCRVLRYMDAHGFSQCMPRRDPTLQEVPLIDFSSGYIQRSIHEFPRQGNVAPWKLYQNYALDMLALRHARIDDGTLRFSGARP